LRVIAPSVAASGKGAAPITSTQFREDPSTGFVGVVILADTGKQLSLFGRLQEPPGLSASEKEYLRSGHTLVSTAGMSASGRGSWNPSPRMPTPSPLSYSIMSPLMEVGIPTASRETPSLWGAASLPLLTPLMP